MQCIYLLGKCGVLDRSQRKKQQFSSGWEQPEVTWWLFNVPSLSEQSEMPSCWTSAQECSSSYHELTEPWLPCPLFLSQFINFLVWWLANSIYWKHSSQHFLFSQDFCSFNFQNYLPGFSLTISLVSNCLNNSKYNSDIHFQKNGEKMSFDLPC